MVDRLITLFESTDRDFSTNGIGPLPDAISCKVDEELNGPYELEMEYPITGRLYDEILFRRILYVKPTPYSDKQPFRIYAISKPISGVVTVNAQHISYDLANYTVSPFSATTLADALEHLSANIDNIDGCPFTFLTDKETVADISFDTPINARTLLGGVEGSILDTYRGEYEWDGFTVRLWNSRGTDRGVSIRYGKNLTDIRQEENISEVYTAVRPYWYRAPSYVNTEEGEQTQTEDDNTGLVELTDEGKIVSSNLIIDSVKYGENEDENHAIINNNGEIIETEDEFKILYAQIQNGIKYTIRCDSTTTVIGGFFTDMPDIGSVAVNGKENINMDEFTAPIDGYVAIQVANSYDLSVIDRLPYKVVFVDAYSEYTRTLPLDLTNEFDSKPTEEELAIMAILYVNNHDLGSPKVSIEVSFINLSDSSEYKDLALLEMVKMGDSVDVDFPKLGVSASAEVVKTHYDVLSGRYTSIELGSVKADLATTISDAKKDTNNNVSPTDLNEAIGEATRLITGQAGGYVVLNPPERPQEIFILDEDSNGVISQAVNVWRWNIEGLGHSSTGYQGPYTTAITYDGKIVADFIKSGTMSANRIFGGQLVLGKNPNTDQRAAGSLIVYNENDNIIGEFNKNGLFLYGSNGFYLIANPSIGFAGMQMMSGHTTPTPVPVDPAHPEIVDTKLFWVNEDEFHMKRGVVEEDILFCGKIRIIPIDIYDSQDPSTKINDGIAFVASS